MLPYMACETYAMHPALANTVSHARASRGGALSPDVHTLDTHVHVHMGVRG